MLAPMSAPAAEPASSYVDLQESSATNYPTILRNFTAWVDRTGEFETRPTDSDSPILWAIAAADSSGVTEPFPVPATLRTAGTPDSPAQLLGLLIDRLALTKSELAKTMRVSRQTVYEWLRGGEMSPANARRLTQMIRVVRQLTSSRDRLLRRFLVEELDEASESLLQLLTREALNLDRVREALAEGLRRSKALETSSADRWLDSLGFRPLSITQQLANQDHNLTNHEREQSE